MAKWVYDSAAMEWRRHYDNLHHGFCYLNLRRWYAKYWDQSPQTRCVVHLGEFRTSKLARAAVDKVHRERTPKGK